MIDSDYVLTMYKTELCNERRVSAILIGMCCLLVLVVCIQIAEIKIRGATIEALEVEIDMLQDTVIDIDAQ